MLIRIVTVLLTVLTVNQAQAALQPLVNVAAEMYPGEAYQIGVNVDEQGNATQFYYQNEKGEFSNYSMASLVEGQVILKRDKYDVVILQAVFNPIDNLADVSLKYLYNGIFNSYKSTPIKLQFNVQSQRYELKSIPEEGEQVRTLTTAYVVTRYLRKTVIGVKSIDLR